MTTRSTSYRLDPDVKRRLAEQAQREGVSERALVERLVSEGLDVLHHPGIVYRDGRSGRRAGLAAGPDVWEVMSALRGTTGAPEQRVAALAEQFGLHPRHIRVAVDFAAAHRARIESEVDANEAAAEREQLAARQRDDLLAG
ncbi:MAG: hypothetical protein ACRCY9_03310 [Phycicoccus sp.]